MRRLRWLSAVILLTTGTMSARHCREVKRVLKARWHLHYYGCDVHGHPVRIWLQTVEALRDASHVQNYASGEWLSFITEARADRGALIADRLPLEFSSWIARMRTRKH